MFKIIRSAVCILVVVSFVALEAVVIKNTTDKILTVHKFVDTDDFSILHWTFVLEPDAECTIQDSIKSFEVVGNEQRFTVNAMDKEIILLTEKDHKITVRYEKQILYDEGL